VGDASARPRWFTAEADTWREDEPRVALHRRGDGRDIEQDPFADQGCTYLLSLDDARALRDEITAALVELTEEESRAE